MLRSDGAAVRIAAPCRADLAGGTMDIWPIGLLHPGSLTVNMAIPVEVRLEVDLRGEPGTVQHTSPDGDMRVLVRDQVEFDLSAAVGFALVPDGGVRVNVDYQAPYRSGIGGSSAYGVALARAVGGATGEPLSDERLVALVRDLEARVLGVPTGEQDHWAAVRGGVLALHLEPGGNRLETLEVSSEWLNDRFTVYFSGIRHRSGMVNWEVYRRRLERDGATRMAFDQIAEAARACRVGLLAHDDTAVSDAIRKEWRARRRLAPEVNPPELEAVLAAATQAGASAVKACGAGGGGSILAWHPAGTREAVVTALDGATDGGRVLANHAAFDGCRVIDSWDGSV